MLVMYCIKYKFGVSVSKLTQKGTVKEFKYYCTSEKIALHSQSHRCKCMLNSFVDKCICTRCILYQITTYLCLLDDTFLFKLIKYINYTFVYTCDL